MLLNFGIHIREVYSELITISALCTATYFTASLSKILSAVMKQTVPKGHLWRHCIESDSGHCFWPLIGSYIILTCHRLVVFVSIGGTIHIYKTSCDLKDLAMPKELAESGSLMFHGHSLFADWWGKNPTNKSHGGECILPFAQQCQSSLETSYNYCPMVKTNISILVLKSEENRIKRSLI